MGSDIRPGLSVKPRAYTSHLTGIVWAFKMLHLFAGRLFFMTAVKGSVITRIFSCSTLSYGESDYHK